MGGKIKYRNVLTFICPCQFVDVVPLHFLSLAVKFAVRLAHDVVDNEILDGKMVFLQLADHPVRHFDA